MTRTSGDHADSPLVVRGTEILRDDPPRIRFQKLARITLDSMFQFVGLLDANGTVLEINKVALDAVGITLADVEGQPFWHSFWWQVSEEVNQTLRASILRAAQGEFVRWDAEIYGRSGGRETIIIDASLCPVFDDHGTVVFICAEGLDITEKKAQEREIAQKNIELQGLLERIRELDEIKTQFFERPSNGQRPPLDSPVSGMAARPLVLVVEDNADMNRFVTQCLAPHYEVISAFDGGDGLEKALRFRPILVVSDIMMPNVSGVELVARMRGMAELRSTPILLLSAKADDDLMAQLLENGAQDFIVKPFSEKDLRVRVRNLVLAELGRQQIDDLRKKAESANRAKDEFLAMLGHELRNPLSPILTAVQLMKLHGPEGSERARTVIERQVTHLTRLVDDLLDVSRIARGKVELKTEVIEIAEVVAKAIEMASPLLEQRTHSLTVTVPRRGLAIDGDPTRLSQVVSNLLTNAAKYTAPGGRIAVSANEDGEAVVVRVQDTGMGIAPDVLPHIFDLFVQEHQASDRAGGGLGLGLTIVRNLVERHGGSVTARSDGLGHGAEVIVRLPKAAGDRQVARGTALAGAAGGSVPAAGAVRILIVDDNEDGAEMLAEALNGRGFDARVAHDAPSALRMAAHFAADIAVLDIGLPIIDGYELASRLRQVPGLEGIRLIALTGYGQESDRKKTREAGFYHHLVKPVDIDALEAKLVMPGVPSRR